MITEDYVSVETAKLLKEKGFDEKCHMCWDEITKVIESADEYATNSELLATYISAPTLQMAMKWLRELHNLWCEIAREGKKGDATWYADVYSLEKEDYVNDGAIRHYVSSYEEACEAGIKYCLENLI